MKKQEFVKRLMELVKQLKGDLGIVPYSDINQPNKFANMSMKEVEENIDDFVSVLIEKECSDEKA